MTPEEEAIVARLRETHRIAPNLSPDVCAEDEERWPCATVRVLDALERITRERDDARALVKAISDDFECVPECDSYFHHPECPVTNHMAAFMQVRQERDEAHKERDHWQDLALGNQRLNQMAWWWAESFAHFWGQVAQAALASMYNGADDFLLRQGLSRLAEVGAQRDAMADALNGLPVSDFMASFPEVQAARDLRQLARRLAHELLSSSQSLRNVCGSSEPCILDEPAVQALLKEKEP